MKYKRIQEESREYKYGPGEQFETEYAAKKYVTDLKNQILMDSVLNGFRESIEEMKVVKVEKLQAFKIIAIIKTPTQIFINQEVE